MSKCNFTLILRGSIEETINRVRTQIEDNKGVFAGDIQSGSFHVNVLGAISGAYTISGQQMEININSKPLFISCNQIETFMRNNLGDAVL